MPWQWERQWYNNSPGGWMIVLILYLCPGLPLDSIYNSMGKQCSLLLLSWPYWYWGKAHFLWSCTSNTHCPLLSSEATRWESQLLAFLTTLCGPELQPETKSFLNVREIIVTYDRNKLWFWCSAKFSYFSIRLITEVQ